MHKRLLGQTPRLSPHIQPVYYSTIIGGGNGTYPYGLGVGYMMNGDNYYDFQWDTTTGYLAVKKPNGTVQIFGGGYTVLAGVGLDYITFWSCAGASNSSPSGAVTYLDCNGYYFNGGFTQIDVRGLTSLETLTCYMNLLDSLQVAGCAAMTELVCDNNAALGGLSVKGCSSLISLSCENCSLGLLEMTGCVSMGSVYCPNNTLTALDLSNMTHLMNVSCDYNDLSAAALNSCYNQLPTVGHGSGTFSRSGNPGAGSDTPSIATVKHWVVS